jgi:hypothetical protein
MEPSGLASLRRRPPTLRGIAVASALFALTLGWPSAASAWGSIAHRLIAGAAQARLSPETRMQMQRLLDLEPGSTLASVSMWADEQRTLATAPWH